MLVGNGGGDGIRTHICTAYEAALAPVPVTPLRFI